MTPGQEAAHTDHSTQAQPAGFNDTLTPFPENLTLVDLFERQAQANPYAVAIRHHETIVTYAQLNERANQVAHFLIGNGTHQRDNIGLLLTRTPAMMVCMLGILKAGAAYVPIDPAYPAGRQQFIIGQSGVRTVLVDVDLQLPATAGLRLVDVRTERFEQYPTHDPSFTISSRDLAYTIYTSGSTGHPKGVMVEHRSAINLILWVNNTFDVNPEDRQLFVTSVCFDLSVYDIFGILATGACIEISDEADTADLDKLITLLRSKNITFWDSVPTTLDYIVRRLEAANNGYIQHKLRLIFLSGDWIPVSLPERLKRFFPNARIISLGGATEGTVWSNYFSITYTDRNWNSIPYGRPIANSFFYILDEELNPVADGDTGELFIGGVGVARGYANDAEKTANSFLPDPFSPLPGATMYRTGDLGRMMPDGNMEFLGRKDEQVKIRGFRVEPGEIENVILLYDQVEQAIVLARELDGMKQLVGYIVPKMRFIKDRMLGIIKDRLAPYMIPVVWIELRAMPLTINGKTDRKALLAMDLPTPQGHATATPPNAAEQEMIEIWQRVLGWKNIGKKDNFFDMGGQSLLAVQLLVEIEKRYNKNLPVNTLFRYPTIEQLVKHIEEVVAEYNYKSLIPIKASGSKEPLYLVHGDGINLTNFDHLAHFVDTEQPVYCLQPLGLHETDIPYNKVQTIARHYIGEMVQHNPNGPYALAGYSSGGYVALEMKLQLEAMGRKVSMLGIFDTNASNLFYNKGLQRTLSQKIIRQIPKLLFIIRNALREPHIVFNYQKMLARKKLEKLGIKTGLKKPEQPEGIEANINKINESHEQAFADYELKKFYGPVHLFRAKERIYFVDDFKYLGWQEFALDGVVLHVCPGDHKTMFLPPHVLTLGRQLQAALDSAK